LQLAIKTGFLQQESIVATHIDVSNIGELIVNTVQPESIWLFGSYARGQATSDSDIDLLIIEKNSFANRSRRKELSRIRKALSEVHVAKDLLLFDIDEVEQWKDSPNHVIARALREGKELYARH